MDRLRYIEISRRNPVTKVRVGGGNCSDICIEIIRAGIEKCTPKCNYQDNPCGCNNTKTLCDPFVAKVCATEIDDDGFAIFEWPEKLYNLKEGWYEGIVMNDCHVCGTLPLRIGPRCNVVEVEYMPIGPDNACAVGCDDDCRDTACHPKYTDPCNGADNYTPSYGA